MHLISLSYAFIRMASYVGRRCLYSFWRILLLITHTTQGEAHLLSLPASHDDKKKEVWFNMTGMKL